MKKVLLLFLFFSFTIIYAQEPENKPRFPKHYISFNPINAKWFQQIGLTYEFKPSMKWGGGITAGIVYANKEEYSNWFLAGPTNLGSLGWYSGYYLIPHANIYFNEPKNPKHAVMGYVAFKAIFKQITLDSAYNNLVWDNSATGDESWIRRKMEDNAIIYGGFIDVGFKAVFSAFFFDVSFGPGILSITHDMIIYRQKNGGLFTGPVKDTDDDTHLTVNFALTLGVAL